MVSILMCMHRCAQRRPVRTPGCHGTQRSHTGSRTRQRRSGSTTRCRPLRLRDGAPTVFPASRLWKRRGLTPLAGWCLKAQPTPTPSSTSICRTARGKSEHLDASQTADVSLCNRCGPSHGNSVVIMGVAGCFRSEYVCSAVLSGRRSLRSKKGWTGSEVMASRLCQAIKGAVLVGTGYVPAPPRGKRVAAPLVGTHLN